MANGEDISKCGKSKESDYKAKGKFPNVTYGINLSKANVSGKEKNAVTLF